ncbi:hypothetical protein [Sphaerisporangium sp. NPDC051011]|uniref:hypothetical protein n=1 Tax=Sphaerisporangium sp. NPDC051011 TaxID=3155792 RepID=UPI0034056E25
MMTATLAAGSLLLTVGGNVPSATAMSPNPDHAVTSTIVATGGTPSPLAPATGPSPTRPKGHTINTHKVRWEKAKPTKDGRKIKVIWWSGVEPCTVLDRVKVRETSKRVTITLYEGQAEDAQNVACILIAIQKVTTVKLKAPLGKRKIVDGARS